MFTVALFARSNVPGIRYSGFGYCNNEILSEHVGAPI